MSSTIATNSPTITNQSTATNNTSTLTSQQQDNGEPPFLSIGTEVSAKYRGAFCEATIQKVERLVKCRVIFKNNLGTAIVIDDNIRGNLRVGATIEAKHPDKNSYLEATISKIIDASQYTVIFDDGDITTLRRTSLCLKSGKHFAESESLDHLPLTNPEHFGNPVSINARGNRRRRRRSAYSTTTFSNSTNQFSDNDDNESIEDSNTSVDDEDSSSIVTHQSGSTSNFKLNTNTSTNNSKDALSLHTLNDYGKIICVEYGDKRSAKFKDLWFPGLIVSPNAQTDSTNKSFDPNLDYLIKSFSNGRFYQIKRKDSKDFTKEMGNQILNDNCSSTSLKSSVEKALNFLEKNELPFNWDYETLIGNSNTSLNENTIDENENESSDDLDSLIEEDEDLDDAKSVEEKDRFVAQLYKYMDERGTPINKTPTIWGDDLDLYNLYRLVIKMGGYNRVCNQDGGWKAIYNKLNLPSNEVATQANAKQLRLAYKKYLLNFVDFFRKLGCTMVDTCMYGSRNSSSRTIRSERSWRTSNESSKQQENLNSKDKTRRKKSTNESAIINDKKDDDDKKSLNGKSTATTSSTSSTIKKSRKNAGRKKFKLEGDDSSNVNGNEPEEKYIPNDSDFESDNDYNFNTPTISKDVVVAVGDRIRVKYGKGKQLKVYEAKVMNFAEISGDNDLQKIKYFVHYTGWNTRYDEWIKRNRIVEVLGDDLKSSKRRGGNKSKNKGVPLTTEEQLSVAVKIEPTVKVEPQAVTQIVSSGKRGRPPSATSFRNQEKQNNENVTTTSNKVIKETNSTNNNNNSNKKLPIITPTKRSRQRSLSECVETDQEDNKQTNEDLVSNLNSKSTDIKKDTQQSINYETEEMDADNDEDSSSDTIKEQPISKRGGYKKLKRSDSLRKEDKIEVDLEQIAEETTNTQKIVESELINRRRQRKKKNDKFTDQQTTTTTTTTTVISGKEEISKPEQTVTATASGKKRKLQPQQQNEHSSDEDDSSNSSTSNNAVSNNLNKFSKRKRISNSKYRQDNVLVSKTESTSSSTTSLSSSSKESELTRRRSKEENIKNDKLIEELSSTSKLTNKQSNSCINQSEQKESDSSIIHQTIISSTTPNELNSTTNNFLLNKEEKPASPICDESSTNHHVTSKNSSSLDTVHHHHQKETTKLSSQTTVQTIVTASTKLCSLSNLDSTNLTNTTISTATTINTTKEIHSTKTNTSSKQQASTSSDSHISNNNNITTTNSNKNENEENECIDSHQQFTPPTTPESLKSSSTSSSLNNDKDSNDEKQINDKNESNVQSLSDHQKIETHGLEMIAIASGVSKLVDIDKQNDKKENNQELDTSKSSNFSPRKKRRGRGRTSSQSESHSTNYNNNSSNNLFNNSFTANNNNKESNESMMKELINSVNKVKGCKTRGSLGRKVKQNQSNLDCMSESTSHSDNFEPTSPSSMLLSCLTLESYNPTSKYNFCTPLDDNLEADKRIQILQERLLELRKTYMNIKSELATIERRRKKFKHKERSTPSSPGSQTENINKTNSPQSSTSSSLASTKDQLTLQRSNSFTENNSNLAENSKNTATINSTPCNLNEQDC